MKSIFTIDDNGQGMEKVRALLREHGFPFTESGADFPDPAGFARFAMDRAIVQVFLLTRDLRIVYVNDEACSSLGYTREELTQMSVSDIDPWFPAPDGFEFSEGWNRFRETRRDRFETFHRARDGRVYPVEVQCNFLEFEGREYSCCFVTDISERKTAEEKLLLQQFCIEKADTIFMQFSVEGKILRVNECACRSLGYTADELLELSDAAIAKAPTNEGRLEYLTILDADGSVTGETVLRRKDGSTFPVEFSANKLDFHGKTFFVGLFRDITGRRKVEEALCFTQFAIDNSFTQAFWTTEEGRIFYVNDAACRSLGFAREVLVGMTIPDIDPSFPPEVFAEHWREIRQKGSVTFESLHRASNGRVYPVEINANHVVFNGREYNCAFATDITERNKAEEALRESERKFRLLIETSPNAIIVIRGERIVYANHAATQVSGFTAEQLMDMEFWNFVHDDFRGAARERILTRLRGEPVSTGFEYRLVGSRGEDKWVAAASVSMDYEGTPSVLVTFADITEVKHTEEALRESEARLKLAMDMAKVVQWEFDGASGMFRFDDQFYALYGTSAEREGGTLMSAESFVRRFVHPEDMADVIAVIERTLLNRDGASTGAMEHRIIHADGEERHISVRFDVIRDRDGRVVRARGANQDITERKRAEEERKSLETLLHQAQKMEAIGQLAGGIAHDFNNILTAIMGFAEVMELRMEQGNPHARHVRQIQAAAERAADLTKGLLAFSRKQVLHTRAYAVHEIVDGVKKMLRRLIPEDIDFRIKSAATGMTVMADRGQLEQVLVNLVTNARDAMPAGGFLTIESEPFAMDDDMCRAHGFGLPGRYARIMVQDTGCGMDEETREKIFEPFFTTKAVGRGTGLGLSITYGIVKQHNGFITVDSSPGLGTIVCVNLPLVEQERLELYEGRGAEAAPGGRETILLVEDDDVVRELNRSIMEEAGYTVAEASDGREAFETFKERGSSVDILVTDVIMPNMDGRSLFREITRIRPDMKVLFMSGYSTDILDGRGFSDDGINFLPKPVLPSVLLKRIREILDRS